MRIHTPLSIVTALLIAAPTASALTLRPILLPVSSSSSSSSSDAASSVSSTETSSSSESSVSSSSVSSSRPMLQLLKPKPSSSSSVSSSSSSAPKFKPVKKQKKEMDEYCKAINATLAKGSSITPSDANVTHFSMTIDLLTKASALCGAMQAAAQDSSSSASSSSSTSSSSGQMYDPMKALHQCKKLSEETSPITKIKMCKYICGTSITDIKTQVCPKE